MTIIAPKRGLEIVDRDGRTESRFQGWAEKVSRTVNETTENLENLTTDDVEEGVNNLYYTDDRVRSMAVGIVSESSGVPTGAIIESGSNANGHYTKFADGTMICRRQFSISRAISTGFMGGFRSTGGVGCDLPAAFIDTNYEVQLTVNGLTAMSVVEQSGSRTTSQIDMHFMAASSQADAVRSVNVTVIGRWYV